jgi:hypothetical protein
VIWGILVGNGKKGKPTSAKVKSQNSRGAQAMQEGRLRLRSANLPIKGDLNVEKPFV